jgi:hypothetical protein
MMRRIESFSGEVKFGFLKDRASFSSPLPLWEKEEKSPGREAGA